MRLFAAAFLAGTAALQQAAGLPEPRLALLAAALALASRLPRHALARALLVAAAAFAAGHGLAAWRAQARLADELPAAWEGRDIAIEGVVAGLPRDDGRGPRFLFDARAVLTAGARVPSRVSLTWYAGRDSQAGA
jgi:competence protein ComEC